MNPNQLNKACDMACVVGIVSHGVGWVLYCAGYHPAAITAFSVSMISCVVALALLGALGR